MFQYLSAYPIIELFNRADVRILLWFNHFAAAHPGLYKMALLLTDKGSDVLVLATLALLWFWPSGESSRTLFATPSLSGRTERRSLWDRWLVTATREDEYQPILTRIHSRAQVLLLGFGGLMAYIFARLIAFELDVNRPFASYWMVKYPPGMDGVFEGLRSFGTFPSDHAAMLAAFACALYFWNQRLGLFWTVVAVVFVICRVAVGFHYPIDMFGGAVIGLVCVWPLLLVYRQRGSLFQKTNILAQAFDLSNAPYCYILYFLVMLVGVEAAMHFEHVLQVLFAVRGEIMGSLNR